jgi:hypothetical protein
VCFAPELVGYSCRVSNDRNRCGEFGENERTARPRKRTRKERPTASGANNEQQDDCEHETS